MDYQCPCALLGILCLLLPAALGSDGAGPVYVTKAAMCSSLKAIEASLYAVPEVGSHRCTLDITECLTLDCSANFTILNDLALLRLTITLNPCASPPSVDLKLWVQGSRVISEMYTQSTNTSLSALGGVAVIVNQEIYGVIFGIVFHDYTGTIPAPISLITDTSVYMYCSSTRRPYVSPSSSPSPSPQCCSCTSTTCTSADIGADCVHGTVHECC